MAETERADYCFAVKEFEDGTPWIALEPRRGSLRCLGPGGFLGLDLRPGTDLAQAREIATFLNANIDKVSHTRF